MKLQYHPISIEDKASKTSRLNPAPYLRILQLIDNKYSSSERGDVLMFLSGMSDISAVVDVVQSYAEINKKWIILPLHSTLSLTQQDKVSHFG